MVKIKIYFDNAATTKVKQKVIDKMVEVMTNDYANADSLHDFGMDIANKIKNEKKVFDKLLGIDSNNVYMTAGGADANNIVLNSIIKSHKKGRIISTKIEHPSVYKTILSKKDDYDVVFVNVDKYGFVDENNLKELLTDDTILVSISYVNSELGTIQNIEKLCNIVKENNSNTIFHTDFVQGLSHLDVDFSKMKVDAITFSSHKIGGPKGIGAFYLKKGVKFKKTIYGSNTQNLLVPRTMPNELVLGFMEALKIIDYKDNDYLNEIKNYTIEKIKKIKNIRINTPKNSVSSILSVSFKNFRGEVILNYLSSYGIYISTGSACSSKKSVTDVIENIKLEDEYKNGVIRISFSIDNTKQQVDKMILKIEEVLDMI